MSEHKMHLAFPGRAVARRAGLNRNHHVRVWCECMDYPILPPGTFSDRPVSDVLADPRRLGSYDELGWADVRESGSVERLWRMHLEEENR